MIEQEFIQVQELVRLLDRIIAAYLHLIDDLPAVLNAAHGKILGDDGQQQLIKYLQAATLIFDRL